MAITIDFKRLEPLWALRYDDFGAPFIHLLDDPVRIESLVGNQTGEFDPLNQGSHTHRVMALARQEKEANQIAQGIG